MIFFLPACIIKAFLQEYFSINQSDTGAIINVPIPEPHTAIPVAKARHFSK